MTCPRAATGFGIRFLPTNLGNEIEKPGREHGKFRACVAKWNWLANATDKASHDSGPDLL
jgi:hypothetical protein